MISRLRLTGKGSCWSKATGCAQDYWRVLSPDVLAQEIADDLQTALDQFTAIAKKLKA